MLSWNCRFFFFRSSRCLLFLLPLITSGSFWNWARFSCWWPWESLSYTDYLPTQSVGIWFAQLFGGFGFNADSRWSLRDWELSWCFPNPEFRHHSVQAFYPVSLSAHWESIGGFSVTTSVRGSSVTHSVESHKGQFPEPPSSWRKFCSQLLQ